MKFDFKIKYDTISIWKLKFNDDCPQMSYKPDLPFLVDTNGLVLVGSSFKEHFKPLDEVSCIITEPDLFLTNALWEVEKEVVIENDLNRIYEIEKELKKYLSNFNNTYQSFSLFDEALTVEKRIITTENFKPPKDNDFIKHNVVDRKKEEEVEENAGLFSDFGEHENT